MANHRYKGVIIHKDEVGKHQLGYTGLAHWYIVETHTIGNKTKGILVYFFTLREVKQYIDNF